MPTETSKKNDTLRSTLPPIAIIKYENQVNLNMHPGSYKWLYETANGIKAQEEGSIKNSGEKGEFLSAQGSFSYVNPDGEEIKLEYTADDNGFKAVGSHLPTPPPIPPEILAALEKNAAEEAAGIFDDGKYKSDSSGKYVADNSGKYVDDGSGKYNRNNDEIRKPDSKKTSRSTSSTPSTKSTIPNLSTQKSDLTSTSINQASNRITEASKPPTTPQPSTQMTTKETTPESTTLEKTTQSDPTEEVKTTETSKTDEITESSTTEASSNAKRKRTTRNPNDDILDESESVPTHCYVYVNNEVYIKTAPECVDYLMSSIALRPGPPYLFSRDGNFGRRIQNYDLENDYYFEQTPPEKDAMSYYYN